jgi:hydroxymethylpyrimidine pyrophosphatase-like HAD family hydrolase
LGGLPFVHHLSSTDYDGTLAYDGIVDDSTVKALETLKQTGRKLVLMTGQELPDLSRAFPVFTCSIAS